MVVVILILLGTKMEVVATATVMVMATQMLTLMVK